MDVDTFVARYPYLYHMAHIDSWLGIEKHGLCSTSALLDLFEYKGFQRKAIEEMHRPESVTITHPHLGKALIRDQKPLREEWLVKTLTGTDASGWYRLLNGRVFFWATTKRLETMLRAYSGASQLVLTLDTAKLVARYGNVIELTHMNTGATHANPAPRSPDTFQPIKKYPRPDVAEVTIPYKVSDVVPLIVSIEAR